MKNEFKIGDVVELKSGSRKMTVEHVEGSLVTCAIWNENALMVTRAIANIDYALLVKVE